MTSMISSDEAHPGAVGNDQPNIRVTVDHKVHEGSMDHGITPGVLGEEICFI